MVSHLVDSLYAFCSRTFLIRFDEETVKLNETCTFRLEIESYPKCDLKDITLECELMHGDTGYSPDAVGGNLFSCSKGNGSVVPPVTFKCLATFKANLHRVNKNISEYVPILFDNSHFCVVQSTVHTILLGTNSRQILLEHL